MNAEIQEQWVAALRSGDYDQGTGLLHDQYEDEYCCLGVLCDLGRKAGVIDEHQAKYAGTCWGENKEVNYIPEEIMHWAGISNSNGLLGDAKTDLIDLNDDHEFSFEQIAHEIETLGVL